LLISFSDDVSEMDSLLEKHVRSLALVFDWHKRKQLFRAVQDQLSL